MPAQSFSGKIAGKVKAQRWRCKIQPQCQRPGGGGALQSVAFQNQTSPLAHSFGHTSFVVEVVLEVMVVLFALTHPSVLVVRGGSHCDTLATQWEARPNTHLRGGWTGATQGVPEAQNALHTEPSQTLLHFSRALLFNVPCKAELQMANNPQMANNRRRKCFC